ncbi:MAG: hypothetical protein M5U19_18530 [Microthrixaceae bacterium]|nr:hypothetical protein [Microthrixaceae bacterium]
MRRSAALITAVGALALGCTGSGEDSGADGSAGGPETSSHPDADLVLSTRGAGVSATTDDRFQSYNVEMVEVTGGNFWAPYDAGDARTARPPIDLSSERLRNLARVGAGLCACRRNLGQLPPYFDVDGTTGGVPPEGFVGVLTTDQWDGVGDFAEAVDAEVVTSFASSDGTRDDSGVWQDEQARALMTYSRDHGIEITAAEFINEPNITIGTTAGYTATDFARDVKAFEATADEILPSMRLVGPGAVDDATLILGSAPPISAEDMLEATGPIFDVFSYHYYPKVSERCGSTEGPEVALTDEFLSRIDADKTFYEDLRDRFVPRHRCGSPRQPRRPVEGTAEATSYVDVFRYLDTLGRQAHGDGNVVFHNTLAASDYGLIDEEGFVPRPNYWAAVLWQRLMGTRSLALDIDDVPENTTVHASCSAGSSDGRVTYLVMNRSESDDLEVAVDGDDVESYLLTSPELLSGRDRSEWQGPGGG